jgi:hypothetical protein
MKQKKGRSNERPFIGRELLSSLRCEFLRHTLATFLLPGELDLVAANGAGVVENNFTTPTHLFLFELDGIAGDGSFFDRNCASAATFNGAGEFAAIGFQRNCHHLRAAPALDFGSPLSINFGLSQSKASNREQTNQ